MARIKILSKSIGEVEAEVIFDRNPRTAEEILKALPIEGIANRWGDEIYFSIPVRLSEENAQEIVEEGDLAYWPPGHALCIFFGPTPVSDTDKPKAASPVNVFGKIKGDPKIFKKVRGGERIRILKSESE
ncbi:MAG: cyclophilin-like fold protein [Candidatus Bathyarchaeia archaeon]